MAVIGTIRKHSALAVVLIGIAIAAFILSDLFSGQGRGSIPPVGKIAGEEITYNDYNRRVEDNLEVQRINLERENLTAQEIFDVRQNTWNQFLSEIILGKEFDKLGLTVTTEELYDLVQGSRPHSLIQQYFQDPNTGMYSPMMVQNFLQNLDQMQPEVRKQWLNLERYIKDDRLNKKYENLVSHGYYVPEAFAKADHDAKRNNAEFRYVAVRYTAIPDDTVTITDKDYQAYYKKNEHTYKQDASRDLDYVIFDVLPSAEDREQIRASIDRIYNEFRETSDIITFVNYTSDNRYDSTWFKQGVLPVTLDSALFAASVGDFIPPFQQDNAWNMAYLMDSQVRPDSMKAEHVLLSYRGAFRAAETVTRTKEDAQRIADSLVNVIKADKSKMQELAEQLSDDPSARDNKGDMGWFADGAMVYPFNEAVQKGKMGDIVTAETIFGIHVINITGKKDPIRKIRAAVINRAVEPSSKTFQDVYTQASIFAGENRTQEKFTQALTEMGLNIRTATYLREMGNSIPGIEYPREIIRWAFYKGIKVGEVSPVFDVGGTYVVAVLTTIRDKGTIPLEQMKDNLKTFVLNEKKGELLTARIKSSGKDIYGIAEEYNTKVDTNLTLTFSARNIPGFGSEYKVIGEIFTMNPGETSEPIIGNGAVFVVSLDRIYEPPAPENYSVYRDQVMNAFRGRVTTNTIFTVLQEKANVEDNRLLFF
ncbi:MAG: SurA N-terminal domain-containing protein [Bacteroidales bacterium]|nr:SurA N-terminal domain-containing protein [Bacteroidales bacterium]